MTYENFYQIAGVKQHAEFEAYLKKILFNKDEREEFYRKMIQINNDVSTDIFKPYFELYSAERKTNQQDYTPDAICKILGEITRSDGEEFQTQPFSAYDPTAGTGSLLISKWWDDMQQEHIFSYAPHRYLYRADEIADNVIPYLLHNLALRGMNCIVVHGDVLEGRAKQVYFVQNSKDDFLGFSDINVMPHSEEVMNEFNIREWEEDPIEHIESGKVVIQWAMPMRRKALNCHKVNPEDIKMPEDLNMVKLDEIANVERAKAGKQYPRGTIVIQISATRGQMGMLKSSGKVKSKYACIKCRDEYLNEFLFYLLQTKTKRHFHKVQEGLNLKLEDIKSIPICSRG